MKRFTSVRINGLYITLIVGLSLILGTAVVYADAVNIDTFVSTGPQSGELCGSFATGPQYHSAASAIGDSRKIYAECGPDATSTVTISMDGNAIGFSQGTGNTTGRGLIIWDGGANPGYSTSDGYDEVIDSIDYATPLGSLVDGTNEGIYFFVTENDLPGLPIHFRIYLDNASDYASHTFVTTGNAPAGVFLPFANFSVNGNFQPFVNIGNPGSFASNDIGAIVIEFDGENGLPATDVSISLVEASPSVFDYGTLPATYENGDPARHLVNPAGPRLGSSVEATAGRTGNPIGDDPDDDGVTFIAGVGAPHGGWTNGTVANGNGGGLQLDIQEAAGVPQVFIDFGSGLVEVTLRDLAGNPLAMPLGVGTHDVYFNVPLGTFDGSNNSQLPVRVRISSSGGLAANGFAPDGEVEDYEYGFGPTAVALIGLGTGQSTLSPIYAIAALLFLVSLLALAVVRRRPDPSV
jgi:hypothetical protein